MLPPAPVRVDVPRDLPADELSAGEAGGTCRCPKYLRSSLPKAADRTPNDIGDLLGAGGKPKASIATSSQSAGKVKGAVDALGAAFDAFESNDEAEAQAVQKSMAAEAEMEASDRTKGADCGRSRDRPREK